MDTEATLLSAIARDPADALGWRVLADWLEEHGQTDRAELARLTLRLRLERRHRQHRRWQARVQELLAAGVTPCVPEMTNSIGMRFALIPPGSFRMGSTNREEHRTADEARHEVEITRAFWLGVFPVTQVQYRKVTRRNPSGFSARGAASASVAGLNTSSLPVDSLSWRDAVAFCDRLSRARQERQAGRVYRLPTDAEWEYACRAGTTTAYYCGATLSAQQANCDGERPGDVGSYAPNAWGLYDLHGQVWEWCHDWFDDGGESYYSSPARDPQGPAEGERRILRGGAWADEGSWCRAAYRNADEPDRASYEYGCRVVCDIPGPLPPDESSPARGGRAGR
jgi:uncharacterized protein (TIGR02996 family)